MRYNIVNGIGAWLTVLGLAAAVEAGAPVTITLDDSATFPFPEKILGAQEEVFTVPYLFQSQLDSYKKLGMTVLRYPCGTPSDWLAWDDVENGYWPSDFEKKRKKLIPDNYVALCQSMGWEPLITVNTTLAGTHDERHRINPTRVESIRSGAAYAAKWVEHANIQKKLGVRYWEIGNEGWVWMKENEYPVHVREYARAMRKVDPSIKIIACGALFDAEYNPFWLKFPNDPAWRDRPVNKTQAKVWTQALLTRARGSFDYLAPHLYVDGDSLDPVQNGKSLFTQIDNGDRLIRQQIEWIRQAKLPVRLALTEWMVNWHFLPDLKDILVANKSLSRENYEKLTPSNSPLHMFVSVLGSADFLGKLIATGYVDIAIAHTMTTGLGLVWDVQAGKTVDPLQPKPAGVAMQFWSQFKGHRILSVKLGGVPTYAYREKSVPILTAYATMSGKTVNVILINRSPDQAVSVAIPASFKGKPARTVTEQTISAASWGENMWQAVDHPERYPFKWTTKSVGVEKLSTYNLPPCRLVRLEIGF